MKTIEEFDNWFLKSKDDALQPINFIFESECKQKKSIVKHLPLNVETGITRKNKRSNSKRSKKSTKSSQKTLNTHKSQKSTSNTNKKQTEQKGRDSIYNSNVVIVHYDDEGNDDYSMDPIQKEVEKLKKIILKNKSCKKKGSRKKNKINVS